MRTIKYMITLTVDDSDKPLSDVELQALDTHMIPESCVVQFGQNEDDHFFIEGMTIERI